MFLTAYFLLSNRSSTFLACKSRGTDLSSNPWRSDGIMDGIKPTGEGKTGHWTNRPRYTENGKEEHLFQLTKSPNLHTHSDRRYCRKRSSYLAVIYAHKLLCSNNRYQSIVLLSPSVSLTSLSAFKNQKLHTLEFMFIYYFEQTRETFIDLRIPSNFLFFFHLFPSPCSLWHSIAFALTCSLSPHTPVLRNVCASCCSFLTISSSISRRRSPWDSLAVSSSSATYSLSAFLCWISLTIVIVVKTWYLWLCACLLPLLFLFLIHTYDKCRLTMELVALSQNTAATAVSR